MSEEPLLLAVFVENTHHDTPADELVAQVHGHVPTGTWKEDIHMNGQRILAFEFPEQPDLKGLERVDHLAWVRTSEGTAWTGPLPPVDDPFSSEFRDIAGTVSLAIYNCPVPVIGAIHRVIVAWEMYAREFNRFLQNKISSSLIFNPFVV